MKALLHRSTNEGAAILAAAAAARPPGCTAKRGLAVTANLLEVTD